MKKLIAIVITFIFIFEGTSYGLRMPMECWGGQRIVETFLKGELKRKTPWQVARESEGRLKPLIISEEHTQTYYAVDFSIKEGFLDPEKTVVINFDRHKDDLDDGKDYPQFNTWERVLIKNKKAARCIDVPREYSLERLVNGSWIGHEFVPSFDLKGKDIVISIDMDYFDWYKKYRTVEEGIDELLKFMRLYRNDIKLITIAYSPVWCRYIAPEKIASILLDRMKAILISPKEMSYSANVDIVKVKPILYQGVCCLEEDVSPLGNVNLDKSNRIAI